MPVMFDVTPFEWVAPGIPVAVVEMRVGDGPGARTLRTVIDSGGGGPVGIYIADSLGPIPGVDVGEPSSLDAAFGGQTVVLRLGRASRITIGGVTLTDEAVAQSDLVDRLARQTRTAVQAIVGQRFLNERVVMFDFSARLVDFGASAGPEDGAIRLLPTPSGRRLVQGLVNGQGPFTFLIDTGSVRSHVSPEVAQRVAMPIGGQSIVHGAGGTTRSATGPANISIGGSALDLAPVLISAEMDAISERNETRIDGILGIDWIGRHRITMDYPGNRMWATPLPASPDNQ